MFGGLKNTGIYPIRDYEAAVYKWESTVPIRGRKDDERPIGKRNKAYMQIRKHPNGDVACVLYRTEVVTFHPDNTITLHVPEQWQTNTTATFIAAVLGWNRVSSGVKDGNVILDLRGDNNYIRLSNSTKLGIKEAGNLTLLGGNLVNIVYTINRKKMNAARAKVLKFRKYLAGVVKLRDGMFDPEESVGLDAFFARHGMGYTVGDLDSWRGKLQWSLKMPKDLWYFKDVNRKVWHEQANKFVELAAKCDDEDMYGLTLWLVLSGGVSFGGRNIRVTEEALNYKLTDLLILTHPDVLEGIPEPQGEIKVNRYKHYVNVLKALDTETTTVQSQ
jgi:hypothetical protein